MPLFGGGPPNVEKLKAKGNAKGLIKALEYEKDAGVRLAAARALGEIGDECAVGPLIELFDDRNEEIQKAAAQALDRIGWKSDTSENRVAYLSIKGHWAECISIGPPAVEPLLKRLDRNRIFDRNRRAKAARALGKIGDERAIGPLIDGLKSPFEKARDAFALALGDLGADRAVETLGQELADYKSEIRVEAAESLGRIGGARAVEFLVGALSTSQDLEDRRRAARKGYSLAFKQHDDAVSFDHHSRTRFSADIRDQAARAERMAEGSLQVKSELGKREFNTCVAAARALGLIGDAAAVPPLIKLLKYKSGPGEYQVRDAAATALGQIGDPRAVKPLIAALDDKNSMVRENASRALEHIAKILVPGHADIAKIDKALGRS